jgi:glycosyltransferase involved in cell wall biosynthesis
MPIRAINDTGTTPRQRGSAVVCIQATGCDQTRIDAHQLRQTAAGVIRQTDRTMPVLLAAAESVTDRLAQELSAELADRTLLSLILESNATAAHAVNAAARAVSPSDLILVTPGIEVAGDWVRRLAAAATSDSTVASATPLSLIDGALGLLDEGRIERTDEDLEELARRLAGGGLRLRPRIASVGEGCSYIRRGALEVVGTLDEALELGQALTDFALRAVAAGFVHVAADDVLIARSTDRQPPLSEEHGVAVNPAQETIADDERGRLHRAIAVGRIALRPLSVTIDGRALVAAVGGTQTYVLDLILALARQDRLALRVLAPPDLSDRAAQALAPLSNVDVLAYEEAVRAPSLTDVVHRPQPVFTAHDLTLLRMLGERLVIGQQDLISYHNHSYHRDFESWRAYRRTARLALSAADQVIFFSEHARRDALAEDLLPYARTHVVGVGTDALESAHDSSVAPDRLEAGEPFLLCLGADYAHKNRPFAIDLLARLGERGWPGRLVLAGPHVPFGSSAPRERELLSSYPRLGESVIDLGPVSEPIKRWLLQHARALVYPTIYEGLGLLPFEAARAEIPCLFAPQASLSELAGDAATIIPWDAAASAVAVEPLLSDGPSRSVHIAALRSVRAPDWSEVSKELIAVYEQAVTAAPSEAAPRAWQELQRETYLAGLEKEVDHLRGVAQDYQDAYHQLEQRVSVGLPLIDEGGLLSLVQQRGLMRVAGRRRLGALLLGPFGALGRMRNRDRGKRGSEDG